MEKTLFIINPVAGGGKAKKLEPSIKKYMENIDLEYDIWLTQKPKDAIELAKSGIIEGYNTIVAVGGDGTVNEVAIGIIESGRGNLGIIPSGTGNDLARTLEIPFELEKALDIIIKGNKKEIDIGLVNNNLFLNIASIGLDSEVVKNTEKIKKRIRSKIAYGVGVINTLLKFRGKKVIIEIDDHLIDRDISLVAVGNGKYYGGGFKILPMAVAEDGYFHVIVVNKASRIKLLVLFPSILFGKHTKFKNMVQVFKAKEIKVITEDKTYLNVDGEIYDIEKETIFTINDEKLPVFCL
ncbi:MAG: diacylglycerol kinase family lipid kinase [Tissierellia bacterium]|nr:diacylglycerol kinase family lipid kinase [Tissierellia bacterium]